MLCTLLTVDQFEQARTQEDCFFVYKFNSRSCPVSERTLTTLLKLQKQSPKPIYFVDVIQTKPVSQHITTSLAVRHESPQIISVKQGTAHAMVSHMSITEDRITSQYNQLSKT